MNERSVIVPLWDSIAKITLRCYDGDMRLQDIDISVGNPTDDDVNRCFKSDPKGVMALKRYLDDQHKRKNKSDDSAYKRNRVGFSAFR